MKNVIIRICTFTGTGNKAMFENAIKNERSGRWGKLWSFGHRYREAPV